MICYMDLYVHPANTWIFSDLSLKSEMPPFASPRVAVDSPIVASNLRGKDHRRMIKHKRLLAKGINPSDNPKGRVKCLADYLAEADAIDAPAHQLEVSYAYYIVFITNYAK